MGARLLHRWGIKVIFCLATALMALGGVIGFLAVDYAMLMVARILQAAAAGLLFPSASTALLTIAAPGKRALWLSLFTAFGGIGFAISPFISGLLLTSFGVHAVFAPTAVAGVLCCIASALAMKPIGERDPRSARIDVLSVLIIFAGLGASMFGISLLEHDALLACGLIGGGCIMLCLFAWRQSCLSVPLLDLRPLKSRMFVVGILLLMFGSLAEHAVRLARRAAGVPRDSGRVRGDALLVGPGPCPADHRGCGAHLGRRGARELSESRDGSRGARSEAAGCGRIHRIRRHPARLIPLIIASGGVLLEPDGGAHA